MQSPVDPPLPETERPAWAHQLFEQQLVVAKQLAVAEATIASLQTTIFSLEATVASLKADIAAHQAEIISTQGQACVAEAALAAANARLLHIEREQANISLYLRVAELPTVLVTIKAAITTYFVAVYLYDGGRANEFTAVLATLNRDGIIKMPKDRPPPPATKIEALELAIKLLKMQTSNSTGSSQRPRTFVLNKKTVEISDVGKTLVSAHDRISVSGALRIARNEAVHMVSFRTFLIIAQHHVAFDAIPPQDSDWDIISRLFIEVHECNFHEVEASLGSDKVDDPAFVLFNPSLFTAPDNVSV